jgi:hypothetical protein
MAEPDDNPYVGPRPFEDTDRRSFFGRESEIREMLSLVVAERVVLLYAASGAGKTSLLQAGLIPLLQEEGFEVFPVARVRAAIPEEELASARNVYSLGALIAWDGEPADRAQPSLADFLARRPHPRDASGFADPRALIFDQFEELFTAHPSYWRQRQDFFVQLAEALDADPLLRVVLAIREDYVASLDPFAELLPGDLRTRFRLGRLGPEQALGAVVKPLEGTRRNYAEGVAEKLVSDLLTFRVDTGSGSPVEVEGEFVEPVQLQVSCQSLWAELPPEVDEITEEHLRTFGDVDEVLRRFYDDAVFAAAAAARVRERRLRGWIEEAFITSVGTRNTIYRSSETTATIPNAAIDELENRHLIRAEFRAGARWYELTHDRFIEPIQTSNARFRALLARRRLRLAMTAVGVLLAAVAVILPAWVLTSSDSSGVSAVAGRVPKIELAILPEPTPNTRLGEFVTNPGLLPAEQRSLHGIVYQIRVESPGVNDRIEITARTGRTGHAPVRVQAEVGSRTRQATEKPPAIVWVAQPQDQGTYYTEITARSSGFGTASERTAAFRVGETGRVEVKNFKLAISASGPGKVVRFPSGVPCNSRCVVDVAAGATADLKAVAGASASFVRWHGACTGTNPTCSISAEGRRTVQAEFGAWITRVLGRSAEGRPIEAIEVGDRSAKQKVLVIGCTHGDECAGIPIAKRLVRSSPRGVDLWVVPNLNPDGYARRTRKNAGGVNLNRNFDWQWESGASALNNGEYRGKRPFSERETRFARDLIRRIHPAITVWYYARTPGSTLPPGVAPSAGSNRVERRYLDVVGKAYTPLSSSGGSGGRGTEWQNARFPGTHAFFVELPIGQLSNAEVNRNTRAVLAVAAMKTAR